MENGEALMEFEFRDGILFATYISKKPITKKVAEKLVAQRKQFAENQPVKLIVVFPHLTNMDKGGRDFLSTADAKEGILASAMVAHTVIGRVILNFFLKLSNSGEKDIPIKVFNNVDDAKEWIKKIPLN